MKGIKSKRWSEQEINLLKEWYPKRSAKECVKITGHPISSVIDKAGRLGIVNVKFLRYDRERIYQMLTDLSRPESCYLLGLIWGDGHLTRYGFSIGIKEEDMDDVAWMFRQLGPIVEYKRTPKGKKTVLRFSANGAKMHAWMTEMGFGIKSDTTPRKLWEAIPAINRGHFLRGWIDADGTWYIGKQHKSGYRSVQWSMAGTNHQDWGVLEDLFKSLGYYYRIQRAKGGVGSYGVGSVIRFTDACKVGCFGDYVYQGYKECPIGFKRKYLKYVEISERRDDIMRRQSAS